MSGPKLICINQKSPHCHRDQVILEPLPRNTDGEAGQLLVCPRCHWPAFIYQGLVLFHDKALPDEWRNALYHACAEQGTPTPAEIRAARRKPRR